jgi:bifunctional UDP-N-acetylglucosamine pyrophosphorylase/glucosamine-1-phosphate N-acetyltransferase
VQAIVEEKDATPAQRQIQEIYSGIMAVPTRLVACVVGAFGQPQRPTRVLPHRCGEVRRGRWPSMWWRTASAEAWQVEGVNNPVQLAQLERAYQQLQAQAFMHAGVRLADPARFDVRGQLACGADVEIDVNCVFEGVVSLGRRRSHWSELRHGQLPTLVQALWFRPSPTLTANNSTVTVGQNARIGPFARLRPGG